jgi:bifunctional aromatase (cyclase/dehydratase)
VSTAKGAAPVIRLSTSCQDVLVAGQDGWLVSHRYVGHDGQ